MRFRGYEIDTVALPRVLAEEELAIAQQRQWPKIQLVSTAMLVIVMMVQAASFGQQIVSPNALARHNQPQVKKSNVIVGFKWIGNEFEYLGPARGDTFPMTWADNNEIYASAGDPGWGGKNSGLDVQEFSGMPPHYNISRVNPMSDYEGFGGEGTKPSGMVSVNGVLYLAFQNLLGVRPPAHGPQNQGQGKEGKIDQHGSDAMIVSSPDHGKTWTPAMKDIKEPMFPGNTFGGPAFVNTGRDNADAPDGYVYAVSTDQWDNGNTLRVGRVPAGRIQDKGAWKWISELKDYDHPHWSSNLQDAISVFTDDGHISLPDMVYISAIKRYILLTWSLKKPFSPLDGTELTIYDAPHPWGPFTLVHHEDIWESVDMNPYCPRLPLKWLQVKDHELVGWIQFSGSWRKDSPHYRSHVREFKMQIKMP